MEAQVGLGQALVTFMCVELLFPTDLPVLQVLIKFGHRMSFQPKADEENSMVSFQIIDPSNWYLICTLHPKVTPARPSEDPPGPTPPHTSTTRPGRQSTDSPSRVNRN